MEIINIKFDDRSYPIYIGQGLISDYDLISQHLPHKKIVIITNDLIADIYLVPLKNSLSPHKDVITIILPDGEKNKNISGLALTEALKNYAQTGLEYTKILNQIIKQNRLTDFEPVRLVNSIKQVELAS